MRLRNKHLSSLLEAVVEDAAHTLVEHLEVAEARLDDGEQPVLVLGQEALRLGRVKRGKLLLELLLRRGGVRVVLMHDHFDLDPLSCAAHAHEGEDLHHAPQPRAVGRARHDKQPLAAREEDGQAVDPLLLLHWVDLVDARLVLRGGAEDLSRAIPRYRERRRRRRARTSQRVASSPVFSL